MRTSVLLLSKASSPKNTDLSLQLVQFLTNVRQQTKMILETESQIPINTEVKLDNRLTPIVAALLTQSKTAVAVPLDNLIQSETNAEAQESVRGFGEKIMKQVIEGEMEPSEAAKEFSRQIKLIFSPDQLQ